MPDRLPVSIELPLSQAGEVYDVVIVGGGPAGAATALSLRQHDATLSVALVEKSDYTAPRVGETLPPLAKRLLEHLGVWEGFDNSHIRREVYGTTVIWGAPVRYDNDYIYTPLGAGWHVDRARFDAMLAAEAQRRGARLVQGAGLRHAEPEGSYWRLSLSNRAVLRARFVVDATGRNAIFARRQGGRFVALDRLTGFARFFVARDQEDPRTLVEAFADGWWYTAGLPGGRRIAACLTDVDIARQLRLREQSSWFRLLETTTAIREQVRHATSIGPAIVRATESRYLASVTGTGWLAVGDAASIVDPLSSQGITKALRSGVFASYAIADHLTNHDDTGLQRYGRFVQKEFDSYRRARAKYYAEEPRWPKSKFWRRRGQA